MPSGRPVQAAPLRSRLAEGVSKRAISFDAPIQLVWLGPAATKSLFHLYHVRASTRHHAPQLFATTDEQCCGANGDGPVSHEPTVAMELMSAMGRKQTLR